MDFTTKKYKILLLALQSEGYYFQTFREFLTSPLQKTIVLRHDVDLLPYNSLEVAQIEKDLGIKSSYYFRIVPESWNLDVMGQIPKLGHEIGYHYEDVDSAITNYELRITNQKDKEKLIDIAYGCFCRNLAVFRKNFDVKTICMHGSPKSKYDNKIIWNKYNYKELGIIGEPYLDIDFDKVFYLTDTGRCWDGWRFSVRDKVDQQETWNKQGVTFHSTDDIIKAVHNDKLPNQIMITTHPQRWTDKPIPWTKELLWQNTKNIRKRSIVKKKIVSRRAAE